jgi:HSP90 family molecular chaperone
LTDPIDEYLTQNLTEYEDKKFQNASKDDLKIGSKDEKAKLKEIKESFKVLTKWWKDLVGGEHVESVKVYSMDYKLHTVVFDDSACLNTSVLSSVETPSRCLYF